MLNAARAVPMIPVSDRGRAMVFYGGILGLRLHEETGGDVLYAAGGGSLLGIYETDHAGKAGHTLAGFFVEDIDAVVAALRERGVTFEEYDLPGLRTVDGIAQLEGERAAWFKDPDGNVLALGERTASGPAD
jgi:catechol 2,3-dioxygenase-like lactoylglutathione lyase family enzyme